MTAISNRSMDREIAASLAKRLQRWRMRAMGLLERLDSLVPDPASASPLQILEAERALRPRQRAPRRTSKPETRG